MSALFNRRAEVYGVLGKHAVGLSLAMAAIVFLADLFTPLGVACGVPYSLAILLALNTSSRRYVIAFAIGCSILTISDLYIGPGRGGSELWKVLTNRSLAVCMIWITLTLGMMRKRSEQLRREAEEQTRLHLADLAHLSRVKTAGQLAATLAHELNQPLAAISIQSEIASRLTRGEGDADPRLLEALMEITDQSHRAAAIVRGVRNLVRKSEQQHAPLQVNDIVSDVARLLDTQFKRSAVHLRLNLNELPEVHGDRIQLEQVLFNLLQNSLDALADSDLNTRRVMIETATNGNERVTLSVCDTGIGLQADNTEQVFERFYSTKQQGMGMGLAISRSIIETHGGRLWAEPNADRGVTFRLTLPQATV